MFFLLVLSTFAFQGGEAYLEMPSNPPKAVIFYFHRYVEKGNSVQAWGESLTPAGYAVAGFTAVPGKNPVELANNALLNLRKNSALQEVPVFAMGASMGALSAAKWFAANSKIRGLILIVPGSPDICNHLTSAAGRPVYLIQAENDELTYGSAAKLRTCVSSTNQFLLKGQGHLFAPSAVTGEIIRWLNALPTAN
jgi:alpha-beta hydrolase superfamily lysophospholipase